MSTEAPPRAARLFGRQAECETLDQALADALAGQSRVTILRGEAGVGKSALLGYISDRVGSWHVARAVGVESEMELAYSGLHQLCAHLLERLDRLPLPQREALETVFGLSTGPAPDRFLVGLAALTLFADAAEQQPLVCIVDDAQWLDHTSAQILGFVARRLLAEPIALVCAARSGIGDDVLAGLPELHVHGLADSDARALLLENVHGPLDAAVCEQIIAESRGNPLALLELPRTWNAAELAGGFGLPTGHPVVSKIEQSYAQRLQLLPTETRLLVLVAAAEPLGDPMLLHRAVETLGLTMAAADPAIDAALLTIGARVEFAHPLVRSAVYRSAPADLRHRVHRALAGATNPEVDPDRCAWHRAHAAVAPDEDVAHELERSAARAQARGGLAAAAAFLERAGLMTPEPAPRAARTLAAANAKRLAGMPADASELLAIAAQGPLDDFRRARAQRLRGEIALDLGRGGDAAPLLLEAAQSLAAFDPALARETHLDALSAASIAGRFSDGMLVAAARAARHAPPAANPPDATDLLLDGLAIQLTEGFTAGAPLLKQALAAFCHEDDRGNREVRWQWMASRAAVALFDDEMWELLAKRYVRVAREVGALSVLPITLTHLAAVSVHKGELKEASTLLDEADRITAATGGPRMLVARAWLGACRRDDTDFLATHNDLVRQATSRADDASLSAGAWARAVFHNARGQYEAAFDAARYASELDDLGVCAWALPELVEAAVRCGKHEEATDAFERLSERAHASGTTLALGFEATTRALVSERDTAEAAYREAIELLSGTNMRIDAARTGLLYGEWLRREGRRVDCRIELRAAHEVFDEAGAAAFADRARRELLATGETLRSRVDETREDLTPQEAQIAGLAASGFTNPEIGAQLFISARTVEWHLHKVFAKLSISSRRQLRAALPESARPVVRA